MAQAQAHFSEADLDSLQAKINTLNLTEGESQALAAMLGGELSQSSEVEPYIYVKTPLGSIRRSFKTPFGTITSARRPS